MDSDLDLRYFKRGGFDLDLDLKFTGLDLNGFMDLDLDEWI